MTCRWGCQLWPGTVDDDTLKIMKDSGFYLVSYGPESLNDDVLISMKKFGVTRAKLKHRSNRPKNIRSRFKGTSFLAIPLKRWRQATRP